MPQAQPLDVLTQPLRGARLIEASAGTGKTFTIAGLYLRLLLGLGGENGFGRLLTVEEILVVTFTEAATEELRGRIRSNIHALRLACLRGSSGQPLLQALLEEIPDLPVAAEVLLAAERQMDEASIYTIHGFCQRMLNQNAFESGVLFSQKLIQDETPLRRQACADFWRRHCYPLPLDIARVISKEWSGPWALLSELTPYLQGEMPVLLHSTGEESLQERHQQIIARINRVKVAWCQAAEELHPLLSDSDISKKSYSKSNLPRWLQQVGEW
ncbi:MAG: UvrD-helicase domain-containing protein, partial [Enterobacteriaceae bacterium]